MQRTVDLNGLMRIATFQMANEDAVAEGEAIFQYFQAKRVILNSNMQDDVWQLTDQKRCYGLPFLLPEEEYKAATWLGCSYTAFLIALRLFVLFQLGTYVLSHIQALLAVCLSLGKNAPEDISPDPQKIPGGMDFLSFLPGESTERDQFMEKLEIAPFSKYGHSRTLAPFGTYVTFEERLSALWADASTEQRVTLFPVYLWWKLTCILPLRPTEFLLTPDACLHLVDGRYVLTVRRTRLKKGRRTVFYRIEQDYDCFDYVIPSGLAEDILWYKQMKASHSPSSLDTLLLPPRAGTYFRYGYMRLLLRNTLTAMAMNPESIHLGDTRHLAMISLVLTGDTPSVCKALANHESVRMSAGYFANMGTLNDCQVLRTICEKLSPAVLEPPRTRNGQIGQANLRLPRGVCTYYTVDSFDVRECVRYWDLTLGLGRCEACPHYYPDSNEVLLQIKRDTQWQLQLSLELLMESLEQLRKGKGYETTVDVLLKQVKTNAVLYMAQLRKEDQYVPSEESVSGKKD